jgi:predicted nucleic acid-binding protein
MSHAPPWLRVVPVDSDGVHAVTADLDLGERAAIALAGALHADLLLIDEAAGRAEAKRLNLRVTGTLGVLRTAAERGLLDVPELIVRLKATSFYADDALLRSAFDRWLRSKRAESSNSRSRSCRIASGSE